MPKQAISKISSARVEIDFKGPERVLGRSDMEVIGFGPLVE